MPKGKYTLADVDTSSQPMGKYTAADIDTSAPPAAPPTPPAAPGFVQGLRNNLAKNTQMVQPNGGFLHDYVARPLLNTANRAGQAVVSPILNGIDELNKPTDQQGQEQFNNSLFGRIANGENVSNSDMAADTLDKVIPGLPLGSRPQEFVREARQSPMNAATNLAGDALGAGMVGAVTHGIAKLPSALKTSIRGPIDEPIVGTNVTPSQRYASAQRLGVNLDAADATNNPFLKGVKKLNENSLFGGNSYEKLGAANTSALQGSTDNFLNKMYPGEREEGGIAIQKALKGNQTALQSKATAGFDSLPQDIPIPGLEEVGKTAQGMAAENSAYQNLFPSLTPKKTMGVVGDVSGLGPQPPAPIRMSPFVDERGQPIASSTQAPPQQPHSFSTAQKLRSDLLDFRRNNPDIVANQGDAMIGNLAGKTDEAITGASSLLNPAQLQAFRDANAAWADMKGTYDDPSSPLYHAVRTDNPSSLFGGIGSKTPENARNLTGRLGPAIDPLRRGTVEGALKTTSDGAPNFKTFGTQLNRIPADYRAELFSPDQNSTLQDIANTSNVLNKDYNPSGSAKLGQKIAEGAALLHPTTMAGPLLQYPVAKLMTNPSMVQRLMAPPTAPNPLFAPAATSAGIFAAPKKKAKP